MKVGGEQFDRSRPVAVIGAGTMGSGIATVTARQGFETFLVDTDLERARAGGASVTRFIRRGIELGKLDPDRGEAAIARVRPTVSFPDLAECSVVIEAVPEQLSLKRTLFAQLDEVLDDDCLIHTNTSTLSVTSIAAGTRRPDRVIGTHYCNPAALMDLVEVASGRLTSPETRERSLAFMSSVGKTVIETKDTPGFLVNRFLIPWENNCIRAFEAGLGTIESIDRAVTGALGHPMGPFRLLDIVGLDVHRLVSMSLYDQLRDPRFAPPPLVDRMIDAGHLGKKSGQGFYAYGDTGAFGT